MRPKAARRRPAGDGAGLRFAPRGLVAAALLCAAASRAGGILAQGGPPASFEHDVKASFVYTVAKFVEWPPEAFDGPGAPLVFAVLGDDPIEASLLRATAGKSVNGHPVAVVRVKHDETPVLFHVLFVGRAQGGRLEELVGRLRDSSVLTVGELERFAQRGGILRLRIDQHMVRFEVNVDAAARARLQISSKILKLGKVVRDRRHALGAP